MNSPRRLTANRTNARSSTGPRTPAGLVRASQNSLQGGLYARALVIPALGETAADLDRFRDAVVADLEPVGAVEGELADRIAGLFWRLRRAARAETAALVAAAGPLPPHPDQVPPFRGTGRAPEEPADPTLESRLGRARGGLAVAPARLTACREAATALDRDPAGRLDWGLANRVLWGAGDELGWSPSPNPWPPVLARAGLVRKEVEQVEWDGNKLRHVLGAVADGAGRDREEFLRAVRGRLDRAAAEVEQQVAELCEEEGRLVAEMLRAREEAAAARVVADGELLLRVSRAEGHLSRELERALALLAGRRADRRSGPLVVAVK